MWWIIRAKFSRALWHRPGQGSRVERHAQTRRAGSDRTAAREHWRGAPRTWRRRPPGRSPLGQRPGGELPPAISMTEREMLRFLRLRTLEKFAASTRVANRFNLERSLSGRDVSNRTTPLLSPSGADTTSLSESGRFTPPPSPPASRGTAGTSSGSAPPPGPCPTSQYTSARSCRNGRRSCRQAAGRSTCRGCRPSPSRR
jgi:hypothetical protein